MLAATLAGIYLNIFINLIGSPAETNGNMNISTFSSKLGDYKKRQWIDAHNFMDRPLSDRAYYGMKDWFYGNELTIDYLRKCETKKTITEDSL
jgi:hypothetical protein